MSLTFIAARARVLAAIGKLRRLVVEEVPLDDSRGRILAADILADRDQPPFHRSTRDGYAVCAADRSTQLHVVAEIAAGSSFTGAISQGQCASIMTGAPLPDGADAVVMIEHTTRTDDEVTLARRVEAGENVVPAGSELRRGAVALAAGASLDAAEIALLASVGAASVPVGRRPVVSILATGDELVEVGVVPGPSQIRNSNSHSLAAQVMRAGGVPRRLPRAPDDPAALRALCEQAIDGADLVILSGGVSMGKHDLVEAVLADLGAEIFFDAVDIRPGKPAVFGVVGGVPFFGLPGNPVSTLVTFELFARPAIALLAGAASCPLRFLSVKLARDFNQRPLALTHFSPARLDGEAGEVSAVPISTQGSGDLAALARADGFIVIAPGVTHVAAGEMVQFVPR